MTISQEIRSHLLNRFRQTCPICGRSNVDLHICHIVPISAGGTDDVANLTVMCPSCHASFDRYQPRELEFIEFANGDCVIIEPIGTPNTISESPGDFTRELT